MGAKTWMIVYSNCDARQALAAGPDLDRQASETLARQLFPGFDLEPLSDGSLSYTNPPKDEIYIGSFAGVSVVAAAEFALDKPSTLAASFLDASLGGTVQLHAMHSVVSWCAFAQWNQGELTRSLSVSPDGGIHEDIGSPLAFEADYWAGKQPIFEPGNAMIDQLGFNFHPLSMGEEALRAFFGYQLEGFVDPSLLRPDDVPLLRFRR